MKRLITLLLPLLLCALPALAQNDPLGWAVAAHHQAYVATAANSKSGTVRLLNPLLAPEDQSDVRVVVVDTLTREGGLSPVLLAENEGGDQKGKVTAKFDASSHSVTIACSPATSGGTVSGYNYLRGTVSGGPYTLLTPGTSGTVCNYVDTQSLVEGTTYFYVVQATGPGGTSGNSAPASAAIPFLPPGIPQNVSATAN